MPAPLVAREFRARHLDLEQVVDASPGHQQVRASLAHAVQQLDLGADLAQRLDDLALVAVAFRRQ